MDSYLSSVISRFFPQRKSILIFVNILKKKHYSNIYFLFYVVCQQLQRDCVA